jgi:hypothetical protein
LLSAKVGKQRRNSHVTSERHPNSALIQSCAVCVCDRAHSAPCNADITFSPVVTGWVWGVTAHAALALPLLRDGGRLACALTAAAAETKKHGHTALHP